MANPEDRLNVVQKDNLQCCSYCGAQHAMIVVFMSFDGQSQINGYLFEL